MSQSEIKFEVTYFDKMLIDKIVQRAEREYPDVIDGPLSLCEALTLCHANACPLDLQRLLDADRGAFMHDILSIPDHLDRRTGRLLHYFRPRCARKAGPRQS